MNMSAIEEAVALVPWAEPNADALGWEPLDEAILRALSGPVPDEYAMGVPLLRFANTDVPARSLWNAVMDPPIPRGKAVCDVFGTRMRVPNTLWVPCGASVVQVTMRNYARDMLQDYTGCNFVWS